jgi:hypothetical protein
MSVSGTGERLASAAEAVLTGDRLRLPRTGQKAHRSSLAAALSSDPTGR